MIAPALTAFRFAIALGAMLLGTVLTLDAASAQRAPPSPKTATQQTTPEPPAAPAEPAPAKPENPGLFNELGKLFVKPADLFPSLKPSEPPAPPVLAPPTQPDDTSVAAPPVVALPAAPPPSTAPTVATAPAAATPKASSLVPQMVQGRTTCPASANGAPDCKAGADKLCQDKGFAGGSSLGMDSAKTCSTKALLDGARHIRDICKTETFVTRAMCQ